MGLDIRKPLGLLLLLIGLELAIWGLISPIQARIGGNLNLTWGAVVAVTGLAFLVSVRGKS